MSTRDKGELLKEAIRIVRNHNLPEEDALMWEDVFALASLPALSLFIDTFHNNDRELFLLTTDNLKEKIYAGDDPNKIQELMKKERDLLKGAAGN